MFNKLLKKLFTLLLFGFIWLFLFSIPVNHNKNLFDIGYYYIVDTKPIHWLKEKLSIGVQTTEKTVKEGKNEVIEKFEKELKK